MIDLTTPDPIRADPFTALRDGDRLQAYAALAADGPIHWVQFPSGGTGWLITGYDAARAALADPRLSKHTSGPGPGPWDDVLPAYVIRAINHHLLNLDPPDHTRLRRLLTAAFTRRRSEALAPRIEELTGSWPRAARWI
jgi:cytochrome P450